MNDLIFFIIYILFMNILGFFIMFSDKRKAIKGRYRTSEKSIFIIALLGGALGIYIGMYAFKHKTKHLKFVILIPIVFAINLLCIYYIIFKII